MRLNGSALNRRAPNGGIRRPVYAAGEAVALIGAELAATRTVRGWGNAASRLEAEFQGSAKRFASGQWLATLEADIAQTVARGGQGAAVLGIDASLFYTRTVLGFGSAEIGLQMRGHVGVVFIDGEAILLPMLAQLEGAKRVKGYGAATFRLDGGLDAAAIRRFEAVAVPLAVSGVADGSHIDSTGIRHVGASGEAVIGLWAKDGGMLRQSFIGSLDFGLLATGSASLEKPSLAGESVTVLTLEGDFRIERRAQGSIALRLSAEAAGEIVVRGQGTAAISLVAAGTGYKQTFPSLGGIPIGMLAALDATRIATGGGTSVAEIEADGAGTRRKLGRSEAVIELLGESDAYLNPYDEDPNEQTFSRPASLRCFVRSGITREWRR